jgi:hypothetical protein
LADRYLASLRLGKQAPEYKRAKQHIDAFIKELEEAEVGVFVVTEQFSLRSPVTPH